MYIYFYVSRVSAKFDILTHARVAVSATFALVGGWLRPKRVFADYLIPKLVFEWGVKMTTPNSKTKRDRKAWEKAFDCSQ